jgi:endonuclease/exonuclease/phosphatase family metal-dependent hydrolase
MRVATFNLESLDLPIEPRALVLGPALERLQADIICLQEVNGQHIAGQRARTLLALDQLLAGTPYATFHRASTAAADGAAHAVDVHNLVTLSRFPILRQRQVLHGLIPPTEVRLVTAEPRVHEPAAIRFDRPILLTELDLGSSKLNVINVHLRAPIAAAVPGGKIGSFAWKRVSAWAEGYYLSGVKRSGQALELRLLIDELFDTDAHALVLVAGDFNAEDHETPLRIAIGAAEDTGNQQLAARTMVVLDRALETARRFSIIHNGRPQMLDHILVSHGLYGQFRGIEVHNEALGDEAVGYAKGMEAMGSYHAAVVANFAP